MASVGAAQRGVDVAVVRKAKAEDLVEKGLYSVTADTVELLDDDYSSGTVELSTQRCTCKANSHGVVCVCLSVAQLIDVLPHPSVDAESSSTDAAENVIPAPDCKTLIEELHHWCQGPSYEDNSALKNILQQAHRVAFGSFRRKTHRRNKISVLHPYRKKILAAKKQVIQTHSRSAQMAGHSSKNTMKCQPFKRKGGSIQSRTKYHKRMKLPSSTKSISN